MDCCSVEVLIFLDLLVLLTSLGPARKHALATHERFCGCAQGRIDKHGKVDEIHLFSIHNANCKYRGGCRLYDFFCHLVAFSHFQRIRSSPDPH